MLVERSLPILKNWSTLEITFWKNWILPTLSIVVKEHKAIIPIAKMRELIDEDDTADTLIDVLIAVSVWCARGLKDKLPYHYKNLRSKE